MPATAQPSFFLPARLTCRLRTDRCVSLKNPASGNTCIKTVFCLRRELCPFNYPVSLFSRKSLS